MIDVDRPVERQLKRIRDIQLEIDEMCELLKTTRERATNISSVLSDMPRTKGANTSKTETAALTILLQAQQMESKINQFLVVRQLVENDIMSLIKDVRKQKILNMRYQNAAKYPYACIGDESRQKVSA